MFKHDLVDTALTRLTHYFGNALIMQPPASATSLAQLERIDGALPQEFIVFLCTCDGLRIGNELCDRRMHLWGTQEILSAIVNPSGPMAPTELMPISGDPMGLRDWLILNDESDEGAVLRWDPWLPSSELVGSSFGAYLDNWVEYALRTHTPDGRIRTAIPPDLHFDVQFCEEHDTRLRSLCKEARTLSWMKGIAQAVACGDDYE